MARPKKSEKSVIVEPVRMVADTPKLPDNICGMIETIDDLTTIRAKLEKELDDLKAEYLAQLKLGEEFGTTAVKIDAIAREINECLTRTVTYYTKSIPALLAS